MGLKIAILKEENATETRVSATPESVKKLKALGHNVFFTEHAGQKALFSDESYTTAGAIRKNSNAETAQGADIILCVQRPDAESLSSVKKGALLIGMLAPQQEDTNLKALQALGLRLMSLEKVPRITRAQSMDVLSSQTNLAGYKAVLEATHYFPRAFPMMMTAAGTIPAARVFVMGAGVAGLQAIATARRLGAIVTATDVRPAAREQVESLGAQFIAVMDEEFKQAESAAGYAKEMSPAYQEKQAALIAEHIKRQDIVITTALIPGRPAPKLLDKNMVESMPSGGVVVDMAAETGGNCSLTEPHKVISHKGITIIGIGNLACLLPTDASALYARNVLNFVSLITNKDTGDLFLDEQDPIIAAMTLSHPAAKPATDLPDKKPKKSAPKKAGAEEPKDTPKDTEDKEPTP